LPGRGVPRATQRGMAAVPPPFPSGARAVPAPPLPRPSAQLPVQPIEQEFDEPTPPPPAELPAAYGAQAFAPPAYGGLPHAQTLHGLGAGLPMGRPQPAYQYQAEQAVPAAVPAPAPRFQPQMIDFSGSATLPEKSSGPPRWLAIAAIVGSLAGGAVLAHRVTEGQVATIVAFDESRRAHPRPTTLDENSLPPRAPAAEPSKQTAEPAEAEAVEAPPAAAPARADAPAHAAKPAHRRAAGKRHAPAHRKPGRH